jgi:thiol:disulfide interchange protein DsbD
MEAVRNFFGVLMLGMAIWLISTIIPTPLEMLLWSALLIVSSVYLHALDALPATKTKWAMFWKGIGVIILLLGISLFFGAMSGSKDPLQPFSGIQATNVAKDIEKGLEFKSIKNSAELDLAIKNAKGKYVMLDFYADWCASCKEYERLTFRDSSVKNRLSQFVLIQADVTQNTKQDLLLLKRFGLYGPPGIIFFDKDGNELIKHKVIGFQEATVFLQTLNQIISL